MKVKKILIKGKKMYKGTFEFNKTEYGSLGETQGKVQKCLNESLKLIKKIGQEEYDKNLFF